MTEEKKQSTRIQTSILNPYEKKALVWLAKRQPRWVTSDMLTAVGVLGSIIIFIGFLLSRSNIYWLWLCVAGLVVNWYGDSLDGSLARVRKTQRPTYGYYLDHTVDVICEAFMFIGAGMSDIILLPIAIGCYLLYLMLTINVSINAHLKSEFKLTYAKLGPTEFRAIVAIGLIALMYIPMKNSIVTTLQIMGDSVNFRVFDIFGLVILAILLVIYVVTVISDLREYARIDPPKKFNPENLE